MARADAQQALKEQQQIKIMPIDAEAISVRLQRDGVVLTYVLPPTVAGVKAPAATLVQARDYCESKREVAEQQLRAAPDSRLYAHELGVFAGLVRLIDACRSSDVIKAELRHIARDRANAEREAIHAEALADEMPDAAPMAEDGAA